MILATPLSHPFPLLATTTVVHVAALVLVIADPSQWTWALAAIAANHLLLSALAVVPRGRLLGPNVSTLPAPAAERNEIALTIDDGPDPEVTPRVLDILDAHQTKATFFCVGREVARHPELAREIVRRGHAIENHTERHRWSFALMGIRGFVRELESAQASIAAVTGSRPAFFRAPAGVRSPLLEPALRRVGLRLVSWTRRGLDTFHRDPDTVLQRLRRGLRAGDILLLHDGHAARTAVGTPVIVEVLPPLLAEIRSRGLKPVTLRSLLQ